MDKEQNEEEMEEPIRFNFMPTLEHVASVKIISLLISSQNFQKKIMSHFRRRRLPYKRKASLERFCHPCLEVLNEGFQRLSFPEGIINKLVYLGEHMLKELDIWICIFNDFKTLSQISYRTQWTCRGRINEFETAKSILSNEEISINDRMKLSKYCCWHRKDKIDIEEVDSCLEAGKYFHAGSNLHLIIYADSNRFAEFPRQSAVRELNIVGSKFSVLCRDGNVDLLRYQWKAWEEDVREFLLSEGLPWCLNCDIMCFLLSQMNLEQQKYCFRYQADYILNMLLDDFFWRDKFLPTFSKFSETIKSKDFSRLIEKLFLNMINTRSYDVKSSDCEYIFKEMLKATPETLKEEVIALDYKDGFLAWSLFNLLKGEHIDSANAFLNFVSSIKHKENKATFFKRFLSIFLRRNIYDCEKFMEFLHSHLSKKDLEELFLENGFYPCLNFISVGFFSQAENLMKVFLGNKDDIFDFKRNLLLKKEVRFLINRATCLGDREYLKSILNFCYSRMENSICAVKGGLVLQGCSIDTLISLLEDHKGLMVISEDFCWHFDGQDELLAGVERDFEEESILASIFWNFTLNNDDSLFVDNFLNWHFASNRKKIKDFSERMRVDAAMHGEMNLQHRYCGIKKPRYIES